MSAPTPPSAERVAELTAALDDPYLAERVPAMTTVERRQLLHSHARLVDVTRLLFNDDWLNAESWASLPPRDSEHHQLPWRRGFVAGVEHVRQCLLVGSDGKAPASASTDNVPACDATRLVEAERLLRTVNQGVLWRKSLEGWGCPRCGTIEGHSNDCIHGRIDAFLSPATATEEPR